MNRAVWFMAALLVACTVLLLLLLSLPLWVSTTALLEMTLVILAWHGFAIVVAAGLAMLVSNGRCT